MLNLLVFVSQDHSCALVIEINHLRSGLSAFASFSFYIKERGVCVF